MKYLYKGMAQGAPTANAGTPTGNRNITPQATGFSQVSGRNFGGGEGGSQAMSVLLSWHEKVCHVRSFVELQFSADLVTSLWRWWDREAL